MMKNGAPQINSALFIGPKDLSHFAFPDKTVEIAEARTFSESKEMQWAMLPQSVGNLAACSSMTSEHTAIELWKWDI